jgi:HEAT repeat protein
MPTRLACAFVVAFVTGLVPAAAPPTGPDAQHVRVLLRRLDSDYFSMRLRADNELRAMGKCVLPHLRVEHARSRSVEVRDRLAVMIRDLTIDERIGQLVELLGDKDVQMRARAIHALRQAGAGVVPLLRQEIRPELSGEQRKQIEKIIAELTPRR